MRAFAILLFSSVLKFCYGSEHSPYTFFADENKRYHACLGKAKSLVLPKRAAISQRDKAKDSLAAVTVLLLATDACSRVGYPPFVSFVRSGSRATGKPPNIRAPIFSRRQRLLQPRAVVEDEGQPTTVAWSSQVRRIIYDAFAPFDKGEFRWSFLVPWTNKTLTSADKVIICTTFIGTALALQGLVYPAASVGVHLSYIAQFFSYTCADPIVFRSLAVLTAFLEIWGTLFERYDSGLLVDGVQSVRSISDLFDQVNQEEIFPLFYDEVFIVLNMYYISRWIVTREFIAQSAEWSEEEELLYTKCFALLGYRRGQFSRLLRSASFKVASEIGDTLTLQGEPITELFVPLNGSVEVRVEGKLAATLPPYQLVGEASLLENLQSPDGELHPESRGTVIAAPGSAYARWPQSAFYELQKDEDSDFGYVIQLMIARQLSEKLKSARISQSSDDAMLVNSSAIESPAEVRKLRAREARYERRIASLERVKQKRVQELIDLQSVVLATTAFLTLILFNLIFGPTPLNLVF